jgi:hypothetical protein
MKYVYLFIICLFFTHASLWATEQWDDSTVTQIALSLRNDPKALQIFMNRVALTRGESSELIEKDTEESLISYARNSLSPYDQITFTADDILEDGAYHEYNSHNICEIDLSEFIPKTVRDIEKIVSYLTDMPLCNLRVLKLPESSALSELIETIFPSDGSQKKYYSLLRIINNSGITEDKLSIIYRHFSAYSSLVRDIPQTRGRSGHTAAFLTIEYKTDYAESWMTSWFEGIEIPNKKIVYRNGDHKEDIALIMSLRTI